MISYSVASCHVNTIFIAFLSAQHYFQQIGLLREHVSAHVCHLQMLFILAVNT
jgi:hypothetical protein